MAQAILEFEQIIGNVEGGQDSQTVERDARGCVGDGSDSLIDVPCQSLHVVEFCCPGRKPERLSEYLDLNVLCQCQVPLRWPEF